MDGVRIAFEDFRPAAPGRAVAFVDDDDRKGVFRVVLAEEAGVVLVFIVQPQRLLGGDMDFGVLRRVVTALCLDDAHTAFGEGQAQFGPRLFPQLVTVAQKQGGLGQLACLMQAP